MKNRLILSSLMVVLVVSVVTVGFAKAAPPTVAETIVLKQSVYAPASHPYIRLPTEFARRVATATGGRVKIEVYPSSSLCPAKEELAAAHGGSIDMTFGVMTYFTGMVPLFNYTALPWSSPLTKEGAAKATLETQPILEKALRGYNVHVLYGFVIPGGVYCLVARKEIRTPAHLKGMKVRTPGGLSDKLAVNWGAAVVSGPASELYSVLQRGIADATIISKASVKGLRLNEIAPYVTDLAMGMNGVLVAVNKDKWNRISKADQKAITGLIPEYLVWLSGEFLKYTEAAQTEWPKLGIKVYVPTPSELELWKAGAKPLWEEYAKSSPEAKEIVDILIKHGGGIK
ncbi:MAG: hypothetical protein COS67_13815 [Deltaproteobacteria bacterium CG06_land_8_20_14_3_00_44_19]|nr:MAG: hypothetical protein COS67_13815 [Deltaproteobacteria bacterium CG06_land_8_20_14_3_00_44_19]